MGPDEDRRNKLNSVKAPCAYLRTTSTVPFEPTCIRALQASGFERRRDGRACHKPLPQLDH